VGDGLGQTSGYLRENDREVVMCPGIIGQEAQRRFVVGDGVRPAARHFRQGNGKIVMRVGIGRFDA